MLRSYRRATPGANIPGTSHVTSLLMKQAVPGRIFTVCPFRQMIEGVNVSCVPHCQCLFRESAPGTRRVGLTLMTASISVRHQPYMRKPLPSNDRRTDRRKPLESSREPEPSRTTIVRVGVNGGDGRIFATEKSIFQSRNRFLAVFATGIRRILAKQEREAVAGEPASPSIRLSKGFLTSCPSVDDGRGKCFLRSTLPNTSLEKAPLERVGLA